MQTIGTATDSPFQTKLALIQLDCPALSASDLKLLEEEHNTGKPHNKRAFWKIDIESEAAYQKIADYTPHQIYYLYLLRLTEFIGLLIGRSPQQIAPYLREGGPTTTQLAEDIYSLKLLLDRSLAMRKLDYQAAPRDTRAVRTKKPQDLHHMVLPRRGRSRSNCCGLG